MNKLKEIGKESIKRVMEKLGIPLDAKAANPDQVNDVVFLYKIAVASQTHLIVNGQGLSRTIEILKIFTKEYESILESLNKLAEDNFKKHEVN